MHHCPHCGAEVQVDGTSCASCGRSLRDREVTGSSASPAPVGDGPITELSFRISLTRILLITIVSYGLYLFYWFYLTWRQYRDHNRAEAYPVWHTLTLSVPIYGLFRMHAHAQVFKELMTLRGLVTTIAPGWAVAALLASSGLYWNPFRGGFGDITHATAITIAVVDLLSIAVITWLLRHLQGNLNGYWRRVSDGRLFDARIGVGEVFLALIGVFLWFDTFATVFSEGYRLGR